MNGYIINPIFFYLLDIAGELDLISAALFILSLIGTIILLIMYGVEVSYSYNAKEDEDVKTIEKFIKLFAKFAVVCLIITVLAR